MRVERLTGFQRRLHQALAEVAPGQVITYGALARRLGCRSARAVGQALRANPLAPEVACHRVVRSDLTLGGYQGRTGEEALARKRMLLEAEGVRFGQDGRVEPGCVLD
ncbi:MAG: MGMT family protein [Verrucomicrobiia bacterium]